MTLQGLKDVSVKLKSASTYQNQAMASWPYFKNQMIYHSRHISVVDVIGPCHAKYPQIQKKNTKHKSYLAMKSDSCNTTVDGSDILHQLI